MLFRIDKNLFSEAWTLLLHKLQEKCFFVYVHETFDIMMPRIFLQQGIESKATYFVIGGTSWRTYLSPVIIIVQIVFKNNMFKEQFLLRNMTT